MTGVEGQVHIPQPSPLSTSLGLRPEAQQGKRWDRNIASVYRVERVPINIPEMLAWLAARAQSPKKAFG